jgi:hypothetical protein
MILHASDPASSVAAADLRKFCRKCHPEAMAGLATWPSGLAKILFEPDVDWSVDARDGEACVYTERFISGRCRPSPGKR